MLNYIWFFMIVIGVIYGFITGNIEKVGSGAIESATEAVKLCITMVGIMSMWMGFMEVARTSGLIRKAEKGLESGCKLAFSQYSKESSRTGKYNNKYYCKYIRPGLGSNSGRFESNGRIVSKACGTKGW